MNIPELVDEMYKAFVDGLGEPLAEHARDFPRALRLAPRPNCPWSEVFSHEVTLGAPALLAEGMDLPPDRVRDGVLAHSLAVIDAFGTDGIEDDQVAPSPSCSPSWAAHRRERDRAVARIFGGPPLPDCDFATADAWSTRAIRRERALLLAKTPVDLEAYEHASLGKQCPGLFASVALARVAGWDDRRCRAVRATLESISLALQMYDDVVDWEDNLSRGGSWTVCLMKGTRQHGTSKDPPTEKQRVREQILQSGVLFTMLSRARLHMRAARRRALALGAERLASWAFSKESRFETLCAAEARNAGYTVRAHALSAWAGEVLA